MSRIRRRVIDRQRKAAGAYYTPAALIALLLDQALEPMLAKMGTAEKARGFRLCDPACGPGDFLREAGVRLARRMAELGGVRGDGTQPIGQGVSRCLYGVEIDARAAEECRRMLRGMFGAGSGSSGDGEAGAGGEDRAVVTVEQQMVGGARAAGVSPCSEDSTVRLTQDSALRTQDFDPNIVTTDALLTPPKFLAPGAFDLVLGNPPFVNSIEGYLTDATKRRLRERFPTIRGAADLAFYFVDLAVRLVKPGGSVALVLPRAILNAPAAARLRAGLPAHLRPNLIYAPERSNLFPGASVFICLLILGPGERCIVSDSPDPMKPDWRTGGIDSDNWWLGMQRILGGPAMAGRIAAGATRAAGAEIATADTAIAVQKTLGDMFDIRASMTAGDAYDALPHLVDSPEGPGQRLVTTGLIDPGHCLWGQRRCRYLRKDFGHPRLADSETLTPSLRRRLEAARRPKILVAGLARKIEAFLDADGQAIGAVATFAIFHPTDDLAALRRLLDHLLSPAMTELLVSSQAANALRGRHITMKKAFLRGLAAPAEMAGENRG